MPPMCLTSSPIPPSTLDGFLESNNGKGKLFRSKFKYLSSEPAKELPEFSGSNSDANLGLGLAKATARFLAVSVWASLEEPSSHEPICGDDVLVGASY